MKPNSAHPKPAAGGASSDAYSLVPMQHGQDHQQFVGYCQQMPPSGGSSFVHQQLHEHPRRYPGSFHVSPGVPVVHQPTAYLQQQHQQQQQHHHHQQQHHHHQQLVQMSSGISPSVYADMAQPSPQLMVTSPAGFSASAVRTTGHQQQLMMAQQQRPGVQPTEMECYDGSTSFPGAHRRYNQQQQQQSCCPMHAFPSSAQYHQPQHVQSLPSTRPPRLTTEAQYFLDPKCTVPFEQPLPKPASTDGCCSNPKCSKRKQS